MECLVSIPTNERFSLTIIKIHLVQLLWFLLDADSEGWRAAVFLEGGLLPLGALGMLLSSWAAAAADRLHYCHTVGRRESRVRWSGRLWGRRGGGAAGWIKARRLITPWCLLDDGDMWDGGLLDWEALGEGRRWQVLQLGAGARWGWGGQCGRLGCQSLLADRISSTHYAGSEIRGHHGAHDLGREVWLRVQGKTRAVLAADQRGVKVIVWLCLYCWNWGKREKLNE